MTDLSEKFAALGTSLGDKIDMLGDKLDTLGTTLDAILTTLNSSSGNIDAAPIVAAIEALRGTAPDNTLERVANAIFGLAGASPGRTITDLYELWNPAEGITPYNMMDNQYMKLVEIIDLVTKSNNALGAAPLNSLEIGSVRGFLSAIMYAVQQSGIVPDGDLNGYLHSDSTLSIDGRRYIVWPDLANISESSSGTELTPDSSWDGYEIYIQTTAPSATLHDITTPAADIESFAVNSWVALGGTHKLAFSVDASYMAKGYLRAPTITEPTFYIWYMGDTEAVETDTGIRYLWKLTKYPSLTYVSLAHAPRAAYGDWGLWRWNITGGNIYSVYGVSSLTTVSQAAIGTFPADTHYIVLQSDSGPLQIELLPPL
jgi:hypothetical protein